MQNTLGNLIGFQSFKNILSMRYSKKISDNFVSGAHALGSVFFACNIFQIAMTTTAI